MKHTYNKNKQNSEFGPPSPLTHYQDGNNFQNFATSHNDYFWPSP